MGLGIGLVVHYSNQATDNSSQQTKLVAAQQGTTVSQVSGIPAKGDSDTRRRLTISKERGKWDPFTTSGIRVGLKSTAITPIEDLNPLSDYNLQPPADYTVRDPSSSVINTLNEITCYLDQLRVSDVGLNLEDTGVNSSDPNPDYKPYIAIVDPAICGGEGSKQQWAVTSATGP